MPTSPPAGGPAASLSSGTSFPANPEGGDVFYRTDENTFYVYDGSGWVAWEIEAHELEHEAGGSDALPIINQPQPGDDEKIYFGADDDYSLRYDSADDTYYIRDEVNATEIEMPKNVAMNIAAHEGRHESGGADEIATLDGLSIGGDTADAHASRHETGGSDAFREVDRFDKSLSGIATAGDFTVLWIGNAADGETVHIDQASFIMSDGTAIPSDCDAIIATLDNAGGGTSRVNILAGDGSTIYDDETGNPLASWTNDTGGALTVAIGIDNGNWNAGSGADQDAQLSVVGVVV